MYIYLISLYPGDLTSMRTAETKILDELENATVEGAGAPTYSCPEADEEEKESAKKKKKVEKENVGASNVSGRGKKGRKPLKVVQVCFCEYFVLSCTVRLSKNYKCRQRNHLLKYCVRVRSTDKGSLSSV